jgi:hypothetical protein
VEERGEGEKGKEPIDANQVQSSLLCEANYIPVIVPDTARDNTGEPREEKKEPKMCRNED